MTIDIPGKAQLPALKQLWQQAFDDPADFIELFFRRGFSPNRCRCVSVDGKVAAALYWFDCQWQGRKLAYLYAVATQAAFRGQGLCRALMEDTAAHLRAEGYQGALLVPATQMLFDLYAKLGYRPFGNMEAVSIRAQQPPVSIWPISADTFETLRRLRLSKDAVLQENETTGFLAAFGEFYTGADTLMCFSREGKTVYFQEFLGDRALLPGILAALGAEKGCLRLPGGDKPSAMYRSFTQDTKLPAYFGIALN